MHKGQYPSIRTTARRRAPSPVMGKYCQVAVDLLLPNIFPFPYRMPFMLEHLLAIEYGMSMISKYIVFSVSLICWEPAHFYTNIPMLQRCGDTRACTCDVSPRQATVRRMPMNEQHSAL